MMMKSLTAFEKIPSLEEDEDEEFLHESKLPQGLKFDTIYFYDEEPDTSPPEFSISAK